MAKDKLSIFWFRRDLRLTDNCGLYHALKGNLPVLPVFIFDKNILNDLENKEDPRVTFIHRTLAGMNRDLKKKSTSLRTFYTTPLQAFRELTKDYDIQEVYTNRDYEPYAKERDAEIKEFLNEKDIEFKTFKDQVIFEKEELAKDDGEPYLVYTPFSNKWLKKLTPSDYEAYTPALQFDNWHPCSFLKIISLKEMGFEEIEMDFPEADLSETTLKNYAESRDYPAERGTSRIGLHLRFGIISVREGLRASRGVSDTYVKELAWREFFMCILDHYPRVVEENFNEKYNQVNWRRSEKDIRKWKEGKTGFPMVDAGMRELNQTGYMHNRLRMITANFLTKLLMIDWRVGEAYFAEKLLDYELSSNNGNWQWAAGSGVDAAPYFRIFNPESQIEKFDKDKKYIKKWIDEYGTEDYPEPMIDYKESREKALEKFKKELN
jgi:deoxyribodipyrimidine photo-lyase